MEEKVKVVFEVEKQYIRDTLLALGFTQKDPKLYSATRSRKMARQADQSDISTYQTFNTLRLWQSIL